jgi:hypothetical protein
MSDLFHKLVKIRSNSAGFVASCPLGLWGVSGPSKEQVEAEAMHYFRLYLNGHEYDRILPEAKP